MDPRLLYIRQRLRRKSGSSASWTVDAGSGIAWPSSSAEWSAFRTANELDVATPDLLYNCQDSSGDLQPAIGEIVLTDAGTVTYGNTVEGWARKFLGTADGTAGRWGSTDARLPDPASADITVLVLATVTETPAAQRSIVELFTNGNVRLRINTTPRLVVFNNPNAATGAASPTGVVRPYWLRYDQGSSTTGGSDAEKLAPTHVNTTGKSLQIGSAVSNPAATRYGGIAVWFSAVPDAAMKALQTAMGFEPAWS